MDVKADIEPTPYITSQDEDHQANRLYSPSEKTKCIMYNMAESKPKTSSEPSSRTSVDRDLDVMRKDYLGLLGVKEGPKVKSELEDSPDCHQQGCGLKDNMTMMHEGQIQQEPSMVREDPEGSGVSGWGSPSCLNEETLGDYSIETECPEPMDDHECEMMQNRMNSRLPNTGMLKPDSYQPHKLDNDQLKSFEVVEIKTELPVPLEGLGGEKGPEIVAYSPTGNSKNGLSRKCSVESDETDVCSSESFGEIEEAVQDINLNWKREKFTERSMKRSKSFHAQSEHVPRPLPGRRQPSRAVKLIKKRSSEEDDLDPNSSWTEENQNNKVPTRKGYKNKRNRCRYGCLTCGGEFVNLSDIREHTRTHDGHKPVYECTRCGRDLRSPNELNTDTMTCTDRKEIQTNKTQNKAKKPNACFWCLTCGQKFTRIGVLREHLRTYKTHKAKRQCKICGKICTSRLAKHMGRHEEGRLFQCDKCGYCTPCLDTYRSHSCVKPPEALKVVQYQRNYWCMTCGEVFFYQASMKYHMSEYAGHKPRNQCTICGKIFSHEKLGEFRTHVKSHETGTSYQCDQCSYSCDTPLKLRQHIYRVHNAVYDKPCPTCGYLFKDDPSLRRHVKDVHIGTREFLCLVCGKAFKQERHLLIHMTIHADMLVSCPICCKSFKNKTAMLLHAKRHKRKERQHQCSTCGKRFYAPHILIAHMACHSDDTPFECKCCGKKFKRIQNLNSHMRTHVDTRDFICDVCGQEFKWKHILQNHRKKHNRQKADINGHV